MVNKIGEDTNAITLSGVGTNSGVNSIRRKQRKVFVTKEIPQGERIYQHMSPTEKSVSIEGVFTGASAGSNVDALESLFTSGKPHILDIAGISTVGTTGSIKFVKVTDLNQEWRGGEEDLWWYDLSCVEVPGWGRVSINKNIGEVIDTCESADWWTPTNIMGTDVNNKVEGYASLSGSYRAGVSTTQYMYVTFTGSGGATGSKDFTQDQGFQFYYKVTGSHTNVANFGLQVKFESATSNDYYIYSCPLPHTGSWTNMGIEKKDFTKFASGDWADMRKLTFILNNTGNTFTGCLWFDEVKSKGYSQDNIVITDLNLDNGTNDFNPNWFKSNYDLNRTTKILSEEFIIWNKSYYTLPTTVSNCDETYNWANSGGTNTLSTDISDYMEGTGSLKVSGTGYLGSQAVTYTFPQPFNMSRKEFLTFWVKPTATGSNNIVVWLETNTSNYYEWGFSLTPNMWHRLVIPIKFSLIQVGTINFVTINNITIFHNGTSGVAYDYWIDDVNIDYAQWARLEAQVPDNLTGSTQWKYRVYSYNPAGYYIGNPIITDNSITPGSTYFLDGGTALTYYMLGAVSYSGSCFYPSNIKGNSVNPNDTSSTGSGTLYYSRYGTKNRVAFAVKMPPYSGTGDLTGAKAIDKLRCKLEIRFLNEEFGWVDGSVTDS